MFPKKTEKELIGCSKDSVCLKRNTFAVLRLISFFSAESFFAKHKKYVLIFSKAANILYSIFYTSLRIVRSLF